MTSNCDVNLAVGLTIYNDEEKAIKEQAGMRADSTDFPGT